MQSPSHEPEYARQSFWRLVIQYRAARVFFYITWPTAAILMAFTIWHRWQYGPSPNIDPNSNWWLAMAALLPALIFVVAFIMPLWIQPRPVAPRVDGIHLDDALPFQETCESARANHKVADLHQEKIVSQFSDEVRWTWSARQDRVKDAWISLAYALDETMSVEVRLRNLADLRELIGERAYRNGWMPCPIPNYGI